MDESRVGPHGYSHGWIKEGGPKPRTPRLAKGPPGVVAPDVGRVTAKADNSQDMIRLGIFEANTANKPQHIYSTHNGWTVSDQPPPGGQGYFRAHPDGRVFKVAREGEKHVGTYRVVKKSPANGHSGLERVKAARSADERDVSELQFGHGSALWKYWTTGKGFAKWSGALHKWRTLRDLLLKAGVPAHSVDGLTTNIIMAVMPGYMKQAHKGRSAMDPDRAAAKKPYGDVAYADPKNGKYPIDTAAHAKAAWSYINQEKNAAQYPMNGVTLSSVKARIMAACKKFGIMISEANSAPPPDCEERTLPLPSPLDITADGDGLTFEGYAAVYNQAARIRASDGDFDEQIMQGAFRAIADGNYPKLMFEHGRHPLIGTMPLGKITDAREDDTGLWIEARLTDNWLVSPVRDAVAAGALDGMSFRFTVDDGGETWQDRSGDVPLRSLTSVSVPELGPVVFPAYQPTTAAVRSVLDRLPVIGRPAAGAVAASGRGGDAAEYAEPDPYMADRFRADGEALALRGIKGVRL